MKATYLCDYIRLTSNFYANVFVSTLSKLTQGTFIVEKKKFLDWLKFYDISTGRAKQQVGPFNSILIIRYVTDVHIHEDEPMSNGPFANFAHASYTVNQKDLF